MSQKGIREDRKKVGEAMRNKKVNMAVAFNFPDLPRYIKFLEESGVTDGLADRQVDRKRQCFEHMEVFPLLYLSKFLTGIKSTRGTSELLSNKAALTLLGFSEDEMENGLNKRGRANQYGDGYERRSKIFAQSTVIDNTAAYNHVEVIECFDDYVKWLSKSGLVEYGDIFILDSTIVETPENYPGAAMTKRQKEHPDGTISEETIYGFKVFILMDSKNKIPVALEITTAEKADCNYLKAMLEKGIENVGPGVIKIIAADRGFIDGEQMWQIKHNLDVDFVIPAKKNMDIWYDVVGLRNEYKDKVVSWKYGKKGMSGGYMVKGAVSYTQYSEAGEENKKDGCPLNAVVITKWSDKEITAGREKVILTTLETDDAIHVLKSYRARSLIENCGFRELKQAADLARLPQTKGRQAEKSAYIHMTLCVFAMATFAGFVSWDKQRAQNAKENYLEKSKNLREYRVNGRSNDGYVFVLFEEWYAIYEIKEYSELLGMEFVPRK